VLRAAQAQLRCVIGRPDLARQHLAGMVAGGFSRVPRDELWLETVMHMAAVAAELPDPGAAAVIYDLLVPYSGRNAVTGVGPHGPVDRALAPLAAVTGRYDDAERHFAAAVKLSERLRAPGWATHARWGWARMLRRRGQGTDLARSRELAVRALADAQVLALTGLAEELRGLAGTLSRPVRNGRRSSPAWPPACCPPSGRWPRPACGSGPMASSRWRPPGPTSAPARGQGPAPAAPCSS
jgi:hypothetical protein